MRWSERFFWGMIAGNSLLFSHNAGSTSTSLDTAIRSANAGTGGDFTVVFDQPSVSLVEQVRAVNSTPSFVYAGATISITGNGNTLNGNTFTRGLFIGGQGSSATGSVTIQNLVFSQCGAFGGSAELTGAGAGMGAGGGLFLGTNARATLNNCTFINCQAFGGSAPPIAVMNNKSGGGGMSGIGPIAAPNGGGGGGFGGNGSGSSSGAGGGASGFAAGDASGTTPGGDFDGNTAPPGPGIGGSFGDNGGFGGGGAGVNFGSGGNGGFGGGGGGSADGIANGGNGGFGGGGGLGGGGQGRGGFGGGAPFGGTPGFGGGTVVGAGFGGAIFMQTGSELTILNGITFTGNTVTAGDVGVSGIANTDPNAGFGALGPDIFMMSSSTLIIDSASSITFQNPIQGNQGNETPGPSVSTTLGGLTKRGSGLLTLSGDNTYTGTTRVEGGELRLNSSVISDVEVTNGAILSGNFEIRRDITGNGGNLINTSGTVSPGVNGIGIIQVAGNYSQGTAGTFRVDITPNGESDRLFFNLNGTATLAGDLVVVLGAGNYIEGTQYTVINAPTSGQFNPPIKVGPNSDFVILQVEYSSVIITVLNNHIFLDQLIASGVPKIVAACFREAVPITPGSDFAIVTELLGTLSGAPLNEALISLSPTRFGVLEWINERNNSYVADVLSQHLFELCCSPRDCNSCDCNASVWISAFGNIMDNHKSLDNLPRYDANAVGALLGVDYCCGPCWTYGASAGYTHTHLQWKSQGDGKGNLNSYYGALYGSYHPECWSIDASVLGGGTDQELERRISFINLQRTAKSDPWSYFVTGHLGLKRKIDLLVDLCGQWQEFQLQPFALADYHYFTWASFTEKGADSLNLHVFSKNQHMIRAEAGLLLSTEKNEDCYCFSPYLGLSWVGEFPLHKSKLKASFIDQSCIMDITSYDTSVQLASPQIGGKYTCCNGVSFMLGYKGLFNKRTRINEVEGRFEWIF